jgi:hypothetical protein
VFLPGRNAVSRMSFLRGQRRYAVVRKKRPVAGTTTGLHGRKVVRPEGTAPRDKRGDFRQAWTGLGDVAIECSPSPEECHPIYRSRIMRAGFPVTSGATMS